MRQLAKSPPRHTPVPRFENHRKKEQIVAVVVVQEEG
jgi:hypothetical protein